MHSRHYLRADDFVLESGEEHARGDDFFSGWEPANRAVVVAPDPRGDLLRVAGIVLAWTHQFYERLAAESEDFYDYPNHYVIGGENGAEPRMLGPTEEAEWSGAWYELDVWPATRHLVAHPDTASMLAAALMVEPTHLLWPSRLSQPKDVEIPFGPGDRKIRRLMRARLESVILYGADPQDDPGAWRLSWSGGAGELTQEAGQLLPGPCEPAARAEWFLSTAVDSFLGLDRPGNEQGS